MLPDALTETIREIGAAAGDSLLLDSRRGRALVSDPARVYEVCLNLKRAGFTRLVDFTGTHMGGDEFALQLTLRHPGHGHAALILKWKWEAISDSRSSNSDLEAAGAAEPGTTADIAQIGNRQSEIGNYNPPRGAGQPGDELQAGSVSTSDLRSTISDLEAGGSSEQGLTADNSGIVNRKSAIHPSLSPIWPAAAVAESEIFEMLGIPFAGNDLDPLLLDPHLPGNPLRRDYAPPRRPNYIDAELRRRHEAALADSLRQATGGRS